MATKKCSHGNTERSTSTYNMDTEITKCCKARMTFFEDGTAYCKCCFGTVYPDFTS